MRRRSISIFVALTAALPVASLARAPRFPRCDDGRYLVRDGRLPGTETPGKVILDASRVSIPTACPGVNARLRTRGRFPDSVTTVKARWPGCAGLMDGAKLVPAKLVARISAICSIMEGSLRSRKAGVDSVFTATVSSCGDGIFDHPPDEECEEEEGCAPEQTCNARCKCEFCGNHSLEAGEVCDPPFEQGECPATLTCRFDCGACESLCGDGIVGPGETCDPAGEEDGCPAGQQCTSGCCACSPCGNGVIDPGEVCEPSSSQGTCATGQRCRFDCSACDGICGDQIVAPDEGCERRAGGCPPGAICDECECTTCGNGALDAGEGCDRSAPDGGCPDGQRCRFHCSGCETCGDRRVGPGETCDPPGEPGDCPTGQHCAFDCRSCTGCGNRMRDADEPCDWSAAPTGCPAGQRCDARCSGCRATCEVP